MNNYTRRTIPPELRDLQKWPQVDTSSLTPEVQDLVSRRQRALRSYLQGLPLSKICQETQIARAWIFRFLSRCLSLHEDGRIYGWRAALPYRRIKEYVRVAVPRPAARGNAGAFSQFVRDHPEIFEALNEVILTTKQLDAIRESRLSHKEIYGHFIRLCRKWEISHTSYPFNGKDRARRALRRYAREVLNTHFSRAALKLGGPDAHLRAGIGMGLGEPLSAKMPFDLVSLDAHAPNMIGCVGIPIEARVELLPIHRLQLIPVIEDYSTAVLGYHVAIGQQPAALDVVKAIRHALSRWSPRKLVLTKQSYPSGAMLPSAAHPELVGLCWNALLIDNASIHIAHTVAEDVRKRLGCAVNYGPVRRWYRRSLIEALHSALERSGFTRMPNTTGTGPEDPRRPDAASKAVEHNIMYEELLDLIDIVVCTYNATPRDSLGHLSPLERLSDAILGASSFWLPRYLPPLPPWAPDLGILVMTPTVRGSRAKGVRPYVQYQHVKYANPVLAQHYDLIGTQIRTHVNLEDLRTMKAFLTSGEEIGVLTAFGGFHRTPHDRALRKSVLRAVREGDLVISLGEDPIASYAVLKAEQALARRAKRTRARHAIVPEATELARTLQKTSLPMPMIAEAVSQAPKLTDPTEPEPEAPSFMPRVRHRGFVG